MKCEIWPDGDEALARTVGQIRIHSTADPDDPDDQCGSYEIELSPCGPHYDQHASWKTGKVRNFLRTMTVYHLITLALQACCIYPEDAA